MDYVNNFSIGDNFSDFANKYNKQNNCDCHINSNNEHIAKHTIKCSLRLKFQAWRERCLMTWEKIKHNPHPTDEDTRKMIEGLIKSRIGYSSKLEVELDSFRKNMGY